MDDEIHAWLRAHYTDLGFEPQGLICPHILIPAGAMAEEDKYALVQAVIDFVNWAFNDAGLIPGEFPVETLGCYFADYYVAQVNNGGHAQYISNSDYGEVTVRLGTLGLKAMGAVGYAGINQAMLAFMASAPEAVREGLMADFSPELAPELEDLNDKFYQIGDDHYYAAQEAWLRSLPCLRPLEPSELETALALVLQKNTERKGRAERARIAKEKSEAASALYRTTKSLCGVIRTRFLGLTAGGLFSPRMLDVGESDDMLFAWGVQTDRGVLYAVFLQRFGWSGRPRAVLYEKGNAKPLAWVSLDRAEYEEIVAPPFRDYKAPK